MIYTSGFSIDLDGFALQTQCLQLQTIVIPSDKLPQRFFISIKTFHRTARGLLDIEEELCLIIIDLFITFLSLFTDAADRMVPADMVVHHVGYNPDEDYT